MRITHHSILWANLSTIQKLLGNIQSHSLTFVSVLYSRTSIYQSASSPPHTHMRLLAVLQMAPRIFQHCVFPSAWNNPVLSICIQTPKPHAQQIAAFIKWEVDLSTLPHWNLFSLQDPILKLIYEPFSLRYPHPKITSPPLISQFSGFTSLQ